MKPTVVEALEEIALAFPESPRTVREDGEGGVYVIMESLPLGGPWLQPATWVGFRIAFQHPYSDVYPHFVRGDLMRRDGGSLGEALSAATFEGRAAIQVSRRSNRRQPGVDTAATKLERVLEWLRNRP